MNRVLRPMVVVGPLLAVVCSYTPALTDEPGDTRFVSHRFVIRLPSFHLHEENVRMDVA